MKIFGKEVTKIRPDPMWYIFTIVFVGLSIINFSIWPVVGWVVFNVTIVPLCIWLHKKNNEAEAKENELKRKYHDGTGL